MVIISIIERSIELIIIALLLSNVAYALPQPVGIAGRVCINEEYQNGIYVTIIDMNTSEYRTVQTSHSGNGEDGWYVVALSSDNNHVIKIRCVYGGELYYNTTIVDLNRPTQFLNLSIDTHGSSGGSENNSGGGEPPPPSPPINNPPVAQFEYEPSNISVNETVRFTDTSYDVDGDLQSRTWTIDDNTYTDEYVEHIFLMPGDYVVSLVVMDSQGNIDIAQKTIHVYGEGCCCGESNETTNETINYNNTENITIYVLARDGYNNTLSDILIEVYDSNNTVVYTSYTNSSGIAKIEVEPGSYKIVANNNNQIKTKQMQFNNDGRVLFLFESNENYESSNVNMWSNGINVIHIILIIVISSIVIIGVLIWKLKKPWHMW